MSHVIRMSLARYAATTVLACAAALAGFNAQAQGRTLKVEASPTAAINAEIKEVRAKHKAELAPLLARKEVAKKEKVAADIAKAEAKLEALRAGVKPVRNTGT